MGQGEKPAAWGFQPGSGEMIEAIAVTLQDEIAAHSFDELTGERLLACPPMLDRAIASWEANHAFSARHYGSLCHTAPRISCCVPMAGRMWNATLRVLFILSHLAPACAIKPCFVAHRW